MYLPVKKTHRCVWAPQNITTVYFKAMQLLPAPKPITELWIPVCTTSAHVHYTGMLLNNCGSPGYKLNIILLRILTTLPHSKRCSAELQLRAGFICAIRYSCTFIARMSPALNCYSALNTVTKSKYTTEQSTQDCHNWNSPEGCGIRPVPNRNLLTTAKRVGGL